MPPKKDDKKAPAKAVAAAPKAKKVLTDAELEAMKPSVKRAARKTKFKAKLEEALASYVNMLVVNIDNVGSNQMQKIRIALRGHAIMLVGKNTMIRRVVRDAIKAGSAHLEALLPLIKGNVGIVFTKADLGMVRKLIMDNKVSAPARAGTFAPNDVIIPAGPTGMDPGMTSFFQALSIPTKIVKAAIEITDPYLLIKSGDKVNSSAVTLLGKLNIKPFYYGMTVLSVFENGSVYAAKILDLSQDDLLKSFVTGVTFLAALGLKISYPCAATVSHTVSNGFKALLSVSLATEYTFPEAQKIKDYLANPGAFASAAPAASSSAAAPAAKAKEPEPEPEEETDMGFSLFD